MRALHIFSIALLGAALGGCVTAPKVLQGEFADITPRESAARDASGMQVRWGGQLIDTQPMPDHTCFQILSRPLGSNSRPVERHRDRSDGRFIACHDGFYDPEVFRPGRELTVSGRVDGNQRISVGEYETTVPRVAAQTIYLWPVRPLVVESRDPWGRHDPFWGPFGWPYHGYYPRPIIVQPQPNPPKK